MPETESIFEFEPKPTIKGYPELHWTGKRPYRSTQYFPAQLREQYGEPKDGWMNKIFWGDNLQVMSHLLKDYRGRIDLIYIDPPFDSKADYKKTVLLKGQTVANDNNSFEEKQYGDIWTNDEYLQYMFERLILLRELLGENGAIYLHCDYHKVHHLRSLMDEVFGADNFLNSLVWMYQTRVSIKSSWKRTHDDILFYKKSGMPTFNWDDDMVLEPLSETTIKKYKYEDEFGKYRLSGRNIKGSPIKSAKDVDPKYEIEHPEWVVRDYLRKGKSASDYFHIDIENQASSLRTNYPTQKPEELLCKLITASTKPGDIVLDCFMGSGTTQSVAMKLGRRFIGADINLGSVQTTTKRLVGVREEINSQIDNADYFTGFEVYNVNNYDFFRNPLEAKELLIEALEIQKFDEGSVYDGELDGRMVKIMPVNRIATKADLNDLVANLPFKTFEKKKEANPSTPVEKFTLVCMGHEPDLKASLEQELAEYVIDVEIVDILRDKAELQLKREAEAEIVVEGDNLVVRSFYPLNLMQKLSLQREYVEDWRQLVESIMIDWNYDGVVMQPLVTDIPDKNTLISGIYKIPEDVGTIKVKITDLLSESLEVEVR
jgi:DNA modification methylase